MTRRIAFQGSIGSILIALTDCAPVRLPNYVAPASLATKSARDDQAEIEVHVMESANEQEHYFGANLSELGLQPIFLRIRNISPNRQLLFDREKIRLTKEGQEQRIPGHTNFRLTTGQNVVLTAGAIFFSPAMFAMSHIALSKAEVGRSMTDKAIYSATLSPNGVASGFIYVSRGPNNTAISGFGVKIELQPYRNGEAENSNMYNITL